MADTITIPSPRVFLTASPVESPSPPRPAPPKPKQPRKRNSGSAKAKASIEKPGDVTGNGVEKKKQSKSRNGCVTCKAKRLKCDETKPTCQQCARRNVECGGYRKDYKWRPFGETSFTTGRPPGSKSKKDIMLEEGLKERMEISASPPDLPASASGSPPDTTETKAVKKERKDSGEPHTAPASDLHEPDADQDMDASTDAFDYGNNASAFTVPEVLPLCTQAELGLDGQTPTISQFPSLEPRMQVHGLPGTSAEVSNPLVSLAGTLSQDPVLMDFDHSIATPLLTPMSMGDQNFFPGDEDDIEEVVRTGFPDMAQDSWAMSLPDFYPSSMASAMTDGSMFSMPDVAVPRGLDMAVGSPEMLTLRFDRQTCGILSVKDGPTENPWRTLIWPLARDSSALYHAIASMTSFHNSNNVPELRVQGIDHMRTSIEALANGIANMRFDTAIATTLALAFAESWDQHTSTGINHIKGAKILVNQALTRHRQVAFTGEELERLKFLTNAWVYMDVLARLTSEDDDESNDFDAAYSKLASSFDGEAHLDPLMGAASTLFPIIGRVANLVRRVRRSKSNSPAMISHAMELKAMLQEWDAPVLDEVPEDPTIDAQHSLQTAEAYRWATLLYLHQAVPEIPSESSAELGKRVMVYLATVPLTSRTVIVHIYPLIAASCEATDEEDRQWVRDRWTSMAHRMKIGVIDRCAEVVTEVWERRDTYEIRTPRRNANLKRGFSFNGDGFDNSSFDPFEWNDPFGGRKRRATNGAFDMPKAMRVNLPRKTSRDAASGEIDHEFTVRGSLHWLGVMKDWGWEVLLG